MSKHYVWIIQNKHYVQGLFLDGALQVDIIFKAASMVSWGVFFQDGVLQAAATFTTMNS